MRRPVERKFERRLPLLVLGMLGVILLGGFLWRLSYRRPPTNAHLAHDARIPRHAKPVYDETVEGDRYVNRDLGLSLRKPASWKMSLGERMESPEHLYEGLLIKVEEQLDGKDLPPTVSVTRRVLKPGQPADPVGYIRDVILSDGKKEVLQAPERTTVQGHHAAKVSFEAGTVEVLQVVILRNREVFALTAMAPKGTLASKKPEIDAVLSSLSLQ